MTFFTRLRKIFFLEVQKLWIFVYYLHFSRLISFFSVAQNRRYWNYLFSKIFSYVLAGVFWRKSNCLWTNAILDNHIFLTGRKRCLTILILSGEVPEYYFCRFLNNLGCMYVHGLSSMRGLCITVIHMANNLQHILLYPD